MKRCVVQCRLYTLYDKVDVWMICQSKSQGHSCRRAPSTWHHVYVTGKRSTVRPYAKKSTFHHLAPSSFLLGLRRMACEFLEVLGLPCTPQHSAGWRGTWMAFLETSPEQRKRRSWQSACTKGRSLSDKQQMTTAAKDRSETRSR